MRRILLLLLAGAWVTLAIVACGDDDDDDDTDAGAATEADMTVVMQDTMQFEPATITVAPGEEVSINLENAGNIKHNFSIDDAEVDESLNASEDGVFTFNAPSNPGEYKIYCNVPGHEEAGMVGTLIVE